MPPDLIDALLPVLAELRRLKVRHYVGGSVASSCYGAFRSTRDADVVAELRAEQVDGFSRALVEAFYVSESMIHSAITRHSSFNLIHYATSFKVDVFVPQAEGYDQAALDRVRFDVVVDEPDRPKVIAPIASPEDVILSKLRWYRLGGCVSDQQWRDVQEVLKVQAPTLEWEYLRHWAGELKLTDILNRAVDEAGVGP